MVHNHGTEDGPGLSCRESITADGQLRGACLDTENTAGAAAAGAPFF